MATELRAGGAVTDAVDVRTGFRDFRLEGGRFLLNGVPIALRGIGKHQETEYSQAAMSDEEIREDFANLRDLGVNCVRLAHYPHAAARVRPGRRDGPPGVGGERPLQRQQDDRHRRPHHARDGPAELQPPQHRDLVGGQRDAGSCASTASPRWRAPRIPIRLITYASNTGGKGKKRYPDLDFIAHNTYRGWYRGEPWEFEQKALEMGFISENGAGAVITNHTDYADARHEVDHFEPEEYRQLMAEVQLQVVFRDQAPRVPMYLVWILRDFAIDKYKGVRNTKGLLTYANFKKDAWYLYKAFLRPDVPVVHITSKTYFLRRGSADQRGQGLLERGRARADRERGVAGPPGQRRVPARQRPPDRQRVLLARPAAPRAQRGGRRATAPATRTGPSSTTTARARPPRRIRWCATCGRATPANRAVFIDQPVQAQWPFYSEFDGTADNTFDLLPEEVAGAGWISTGRMSKPEHRSALSFTAGAPAEVFVMGSEASALDQALRRAGFEATGRTGRWRNDALALVPYRLFRRAVAAGDRVSIPPVTADYVVLVKREGGRKVDSAVMTTTPEPLAGKRRPRSRPPGRARPFLVLQFFIFPLSIVAVCVAVFVVFGMIASEGKGAREHLADVRTGGANRRWQAAFELAKVLQAGKDPALTDPAFTGEVAKVFDEASADDPRVRRYLALALGRIGDRRAVPALLKAVDDAGADGSRSDPETQVYAVWALGVIGDPQAVPRLVALARSDDAGPAQGRRPCAGRVPRRGVARGAGDRALRSRHRRAVERGRRAGPPPRSGGGAGAARHDGSRRAGRRSRPHRRAALGGDGAGGGGGGRRCTTRASTRPSGDCATAIPI